MKMMNIFPKTRFSGLVVMIILFLILTMGSVTLIIRYNNEKRLIKIGFIKLQQNSVSIKSKVTVLSKLKSLPTQAQSWGVNGTALSFNSEGNVTAFQNTKESDTRIFASSFFSDILRRSFFDEYIVFSDKNELIYKTLDADALDYSNYLNKLKKTIYIPMSYRISGGKKDSLLMGNNWNSGFISKTIINYEKYYQFVYPIQINNTRWYISGLISSKNFHEKKQHVETWVLIIIGILLIFTLFSFQFIKLYILSKNERINTSDLVMICFSISGIACIITLLIINIFSLNKIRSNTNKQLKELSYSIKTSFTTELNLMYQNVAEYEKKGKDNPTIKNALTNKSFQKDTSGLRSVIDNYPYFKSLFRSDAGWTSNIITTWNHDTTSRINYRKYYRYKDDWMLPGSEGKKRFMLESVFSNTSGDVIAVLAKPSENHYDTVYCISSPMYSLINTVLHSGFEFRIIGEDGTVLFHNDQNKNNRENFLHECNNNMEIEEAIHNRTAITMPLKISLRNYQSHISPIGTLPLYLITLCNTKEQNEFLSHINYTLLIFIILGLLCAIICTIIFYYEKLSKAGKMIDPDAEPGLIWLLPDRRKNIRYLAITVLNLLLGIFISIPLFFRNSTILHFLLILFTAYSFYFIYSYTILKTFRSGSYKKSIAIVFSIVILLCNALYSICLQNYLLFLALQLLALALIIIILSRIFSVRNVKAEFPESSSNTMMRLFKKVRDPFLPYVLFVFSWMLISCVLPTIYLFRIAGREEVVLMTRKNQLEVASRIERKGLLIDSTLIKNLYPENDAAGIPVIKRLKDSLIQKGNYLPNGTRARFIPAETLTPPADGLPGENYILFSKYLREMIKKEDIRTYQMLYGAGLDTVWNWTGGYYSLPVCNELNMYYTARQMDAGGFYSGYKIKLTSDLHNQKISHAHNSFATIVLITIVFMFFMVFLFLIIRMVVKYLFILEQPVVLNMISNSTNIPKTGNLFLINTLNQNAIIEDLKSSHQIVSTEKSENQAISSGTLVILNSLPENPEKWRLWIGTMDKIIEKSGNVIILSCYTSKQIRSFLDQHIQHDTPRTIAEVYIEIKQHVIRLLACFTVHFVKETQVKESVETGSRPFDMPQNRKVQQVYDSHYYYLWEKCTLNEKFILSDLALDAVVNGKNKEDIINLVGKGILEVRGKLNFTDQGFKHYIELMILTDELADLKQYSRREDGWSKIKNPLYIIFGLVVVFFFFTQQDLIAGLTGTIVSITGILGTLFSILFGKTADIEK